MSKIDGKHNEPATETGKALMASPAQINSKLALHRSTDSFPPRFAIIHRIMFQFQHYVYILCVHTFTAEITVKSAYNLPHV